MNDRKEIEPIQLTIFRRANILTLDLGDRKTLSPKSEVKVEKEFLDSIESRINRLAEYANKWPRKLSAGSGSEDQN